jgi:hypothetical protein
LFAYRELDDALGLTAMAGETLADARTGKNGRHALARITRSIVRADVPCGMTFGAFALVSAFGACADTGPRAEFRVKLAAAAPGAGRMT